MSVFVWTVSDVVELVLVSLVAFLAIAFWASNKIKQRMCKHDRGVNETRSCDAVCRKCGKNLGFIGLWNAQAHRESDGAGGSKEGK